MKIENVSIDSALKLSEPKVHLSSGVATVARLYAGVVPPWIQPDTCLNVHYLHKDVRCQTSQTTTTSLTQL